MTEVLCLSHIIEDRPRALETSLLGAGPWPMPPSRARRNPSLIDLATESYRLIGERPDLRSVVFGADVPDDGCSALGLGGLALALPCRAAPERAADRDRECPYRASDVVKTD